MDVRVYVMFWDVNQTIYGGLSILLPDSFGVECKLSRMEFEPIGESCHVPSAPKK